jgi:hypothetical protein
MRRRGSPGQHYRWLQNELLQTTEGYAVWSRIADLFVELLAKKSLAGETL